MLQVREYMLTSPHLWGMTDDLVVTIAGDLTREELLTIGSALEPE